MTEEGKRVSYSPKEFAALFGKSQTWGYRQIYAGKVKTISEVGRLSIPASEVEKILKTAGRYEGRPKAKAGNTQASDRMADVTGTAWQRYITRKKEDGVKAKKRKASAEAKKAHKGALARMMREQK